MISCSCLPVCLSGVQISAQARLPHHHRRSPHGDIRARSNTRRGETCDLDPSSVASDHSTSSSLGTPPTNVLPTEKLEREGTLDCSNTGQMRMRWPRLALAREMADLDRRREALKKQHGPRNAMYLMEAYIIFREERDSFVSCFKSTSGLQDQSECPNIHFCAKAA